MRRQCEVASTIVFITLLVLLVLPLPMTRSSLPGTYTKNHTRRTIIVNASGGGDHTTIQSGIHAAQNGDTVYVEAGEYSGGIWIDKRVNLIGEGRENTIINGSYSWSAIGISYTDDVEIKGFNISLGYAGIRIDNAMNCRIENNIFHRNEEAIFFNSSTHIWHNQIIQ